MWLAGFELAERLLVFSSVILGGWPGRFFIPTPALQRWWVANRRGPLSTWDEAEGYPVDQPNAQHGLASLNTLCPFHIVSRHLAGGFLLRKDFYDVVMVDGDTQIENILL